MPLIIKYLLFSLAITDVIISQNFWERIPSPTDNFLRTIQFTDSLRGWVGGDSGSIFYTSDGGLNWTKQQTNTSNKIMKLFFLDEYRGWALAWSESAAGDDNFFGTEILQTTDGGLNWSVERYREDDTYLKGIYFLDTLKGFMGGVPGKFLATTDGGLTWEPANIDSGVFASFPVINFKFFSNLYGFASGGKFDIAGVVWKTTNGGDSWTPMDPQYTPPDEIWDVHFFDSLHVMGVGGDPDFFGVGLIHSTDAGNTWDYFEIGVYGQALAISFRTQNEGWAVVPQSECFVATFDYGYTWTTYSAPDSTQLYDVFFTDSITGYAVGYGGVILKYKYQFPDFVEPDSNQLAASFELNQNYPNPFNSSTVIRFSLSKPGDVDIKVYDVLGIEVTSLVEEYKPTGTFEVIWNGNSEPSGVYYVQMVMDGKLLTRKMILLK